MNQEFIRFCNSRDAPLPLLIQEFQSKYPEFNVDKFIIWKREQLSVSRTNFYKYPFLRDHFFISYLKSLQSESQEYLFNFKNFVFYAQTEYYSKFVDPNFMPSHLNMGNSEKVSKCPFARKNAPTSKCEPFSIDYDLTLPRYSIIENTSISDLGFDNLTVNIVKAGRSQSDKAAIYIFMEGSHSNVSFENNDSVKIICSGSSFIETKLLVTESSNKFSKDVINEIIATKSVLTASDVRFLFNDQNIFIIDQSNVNLLLNLVVYLNLYRIPLISEILKAQGIESFTCGPSLMEPYKDLLTVEYIKCNNDLFK